MNKSSKIVLATALALSVIFSFTLIDNKVSANNQVSLDYIDSRSLDLTNKLRAENSLPALKWNSKLSNAAFLKAEDMVKNNYFEHTSPTGKKAWSFIDESGYNYSKAGENLAIDFDSLNETFDAWENSPSHKENILSDRFTDFGFATVDGIINGQKTTISVQIFASEMPIYDRIFSNLGG